MFILLQIRTRLLGRFVEQFEYCFLHFDENSFLPFMSDVSEGQELLQASHCLRTEHKERITDIIENTVQYRQNVVGNANLTPREIRIDPHAATCALHVACMHENTTVLLINTLMNLLERVDDPFRRITVLDRILEEVWQ